MQGFIIDRTKSPEFSGKIDFVLFPVQKGKVFKNIDMRIQYLEGVQLKRVDDEWRNIICYMAHKYPLMKPMLLMKSTVELEKNIIHVKMHIRGADFLRAKKTDKELENVIKKL